MKKSTKGFIVFAIIIILFIPVPMRLKDGGSVEYKALLYKYTKVHRLNEKAVGGYEDGVIFELFGMEVYRDIHYDEIKEKDNKTDNKETKEEDKKEEEVIIKEEEKEKEEKQVIEQVDVKMLNNLKNEITNKISLLDNYNNLASIYVDEDNLKVVVVLMNNSEEEIEWFKNNINNSEFITFDSSDEIEILG